MDGMPMMRWMIALGALFVLAAVIALLALAVYLLRRSRRPPTVT